MSEGFKVLLTNPMHQAGVAIIEGVAEPVIAPDQDAQTLRELAGDVDGIVVRAQLPDDILDHAPKVRGIVRHGVGLDFIPVDAATQRGVPVANLPGSNTRAVAEYCLSAIMHLRRPIAKVDRDLRSNGWNAARPQANDFLDTGGSVLGIVGVGTIGRALAAIAHYGLGMRVIGASRRPGRMPDPVTEVSVDELFAQADAIVLCCALTAETRGLASAARIASMKKDAVIVNVSRGPVVDTDALINALNARAILGAATDVYDTHPLAPDHPLLDCPNLLLTPHIAGITATSLRNMGVGAAEEMVRMLKGQKPVNLVNPDYEKQRERQ